MILEHQFSVQPQVAEGQEVSATKKVRLLRLPPLLVVHLIRFAYDGATGEGSFPQDDIWTCVKQCVFLMNTGSTACAVQGPHLIRFAYDGATSEQQSAKDRLDRASNGCGAVLAAGSAACQALTSPAASALAPPVHLERTHLLYCQQAGVHSDSLP